MTNRGYVMLCSCNPEVLPAGDVTGGFPSAIEGLAVEVCAEAASVRERAADDDLKALWVESCEGIEPINLAAACKSDHPATEVFLVAADRTGSVVSRANAAHLDGIVHPSDLGDRLREAALRLAGDEKCGHREERAPALTETPSERGDKARSGFLLTVVSGSGGAGKSTVAVLAALAGARRGLRTALLDADLQFGDLGDLAGFCPAVSIEEVVAKQAVPEEVGEAPLALLRAPRALERSEAISESLGALVELVCQAFDFVVVNTGGSWGEQHLQLLERSAATLFLVDQRASSVRACRHALDLCLRCGIATSSFLLAVNRCTRHAPFTSIDVSSALDGAHVVELADGGREVEELLGSGLAHDLADEANPLYASIERMLDELLFLPHQEAEGGVQVSLGRIGLKARTEGAGSKRAKRKGRLSRRDRVLAAKAR
ncbi:AAA family ATPase [Adlercreutzia shanghongiae]|uniref:P-loop NTPase n=1 Tax=Adlercreutzia shanghongiae TaxID=3111773 RepID=A0ABU6IZV0_9ACTN|nr:P-loop NTPase [Adlercreutzia sp. R22]MEC4295382.1 P-loop NTPase [Adlercreutzia sp. R22]